MVLYSPLLKSLLCLTLVKHMPVASVSSDHRYAYTLWPSDGTDCQSRRATVKMLCWQFSDCTCYTLQLVLRRTFSVRRPRQQTYKTAVDIIKCGARSGSPQIIFKALMFEWVLKFRIWVLTVMLGTMYLYLSDTSNWWVPMLLSLRYLVPSLFHTLPTLHFVIFPVLLQVCSQYYIVYISSFAVQSMCACGTDYASYF